MTLGLDDVVRRASYPSVLVVLNLIVGLEVKVLLEVQFLGYLPLERRGGAFEESLKLAVEHSKYVVTNSCLEPRLQLNVKLTVLDLVIGMAKPLFEVGPRISDVIVLHHLVCVSLFQARDKRRPCLVVVVSKLLDRIALGE